MATMLFTEDREKDCCRYVCIVHFTNYYTLPRLTHIRLTGSKIIPDARVTAIYSFIWTKTVLPVFVPFYQYICRSMPKGNQYRPICPS